MGLFNEILDNGSESAPIIPGITTGTVKENWDKDYPGMIKVEIILGVAGKNLTGWVPICVPYAGAEHGAYVLPEIGSEVVIAFHMGDRNCPIVIGSLWNQKNPLPAKTANENNTVKRFRTKGGCEIVFDDEKDKQNILVTTPKQLSMLINDEKSIIQIQDESGKNGILIDSENGTLTLKAEKKIEIKAGDATTISLDGSSKTLQLKSDNIKAEAGQGISLKGQNDKIESAMLGIKAQSSLKVESGAIAEIKGTLVKIN